MSNRKINTQNLIAMVTTSKAFRHTAKMNDADWWGSSGSVGGKSFSAPIHFHLEKK